MDIETAIHTCSPQLQMLKLENHIKFPVFLANPFICILDTNAIRFTDSHNVIFIKCFLLQLFQKHLNTIAVHMSVKGRYILLVLRIRQIRKSGYFFNMRNSVYTETV